MNTQTEQIKLLDQISQANEAQVDSMWAIQNIKKSASIERLLAFAKS